MPERSSHIPFFLLPSIAFVLPAKPYAGNPSQKCIPLTKVSFSLFSFICKYQSTLAKRHKGKITIESILETFMGVGDWGGQRLGTLGRQGEKISI